MHLITDLVDKYKKESKKKVAKIKEELKLYDSNIGENELSDKISSILEKVYTEAHTNAQKGVFKSSINLDLNLNHVLDNQAFEYLKEVFKDSEEFIVENQEDIAVIKVILPID